MLFKPGVKIFGITPELMTGLLVADGIYHAQGFKMVVTSVVDGRHSLTSLHYAGQAADLRTRNMGTDDTKQEIGNLIRESLTSEFDVVVEKTHIHLEFQPKRSG